MTWETLTDSGAISGDITSSASAASAALSRGANRLDPFAVGSNHATHHTALQSSDTRRSGRGGRSSLGDNPIAGDQFDNALSGSSTPDVISAKRGADLIAGNRSSDDLYGNAGADVIRGNAGADRLYGNKGADTLYGNAGKDALYGNAGIDTLYGNRGPDALYGFLHDDVLFGGKANDLISGGSGNDRISGGKGNDTIRGGKGADILVGGFGADSFVLAPGTGGATVSQSDLIVDYAAGQDSIQLAKGLTPTDLVLTTKAGSTVIQAKKTNEILAVVQGVDLKIIPGSNPRILDSASVKTIARPISRPNMGTGTLRSITQDPGNTTAEALDIAGSSNTLTYQQQVSAADPDDYYAFSVGASSTLMLTLTGLSQNADICLFDSAGNAIQDSTQTGTANEFVAQPLDTGFYFIRIYAPDAKTTDYNLNVTLMSNLPGITTDAPEGSEQLFTYESSRLIELEPSNNRQGFRSDSSFAGIDGKGFSTVIIDTGIDLDHPFFGPDTDGNGVADRIVYQRDFAEKDFDASDRDNHGSHVASIVASQDSFETGMAPAANIIALKVFPDRPRPGKDKIEADPKDTELALQWVVANAEKYNIVSVNMSLGGGNYQQSVVSGYSDELAELKRKGVIVVASAGNDFAEFGSAPGVAFPAADPNALAVGATGDEDARIAGFSQRDPNLIDIFAPGVSITGANASGGTVDLDGTSMAAPHIAGLAVLAQQLAVEKMGRRLTVDEFRDLLQSAGSIINDGDDEDDNVTNTGANYRFVNALILGKAILFAAAPPQFPAPPPPPPPDAALARYNFTYIYDGGTGTSSEHYDGYVFAPPGSLTVGSLYDPVAAANERGTNGLYYISGIEAAPDTAVAGQVFVQQYYAEVTSNSINAAVPLSATLGLPAGYNGIGSEITFASTKDANGNPRLELFGADFWAADLNNRVATDIGF